VKKGQAFEVLRWPSSRNQERRSSEGAARDLEKGTGRGEESKVRKLLGQLQR